jgi:hypothetical protein
MFTGLDSKLVEISFFGLSLNAVVTTTGCVPVVLVGISTISKEAFVRTLCRITKGANHRFAGIKPVGCGTLGFSDGTFGGVHDSFRQLRRGGSVGFTGCVLEEDCFNMVSKFLVFKLVAVEEAPVDGVFN